MDSPPWGDRYAALIEAAGDAILIIDFDSALFLEANQAACDLFGYTVEELRSRTGRMMHPPGEDEAIVQLSRGLMEEGGAWCPKIRCQKSDGTLFWGEIRSTCYESAGQKLYVSIVRDVTERVEREEELARAHDHLQRAHEKLLHSGKLAVIGELAAGVAHEVNNPAAFVQLNIAAVRESVAQLRASDVNADHQATLAGIDAAMAESELGMSRIVAIVRSLKAFTAPKLAAIQETELSQVIDHACAMAATEIRHRARLEKEYGEVPAIAADAGQLTQVILNLLLNAAESIAEGDAQANEIRVTTRRRDSEVVISVRDTGPGIAPSVRGRLFDPFVTTKAGTGQGLGLSLCADIVARHGGRIELVSADAPGAQFDVVLPLDTGFQVVAAAAPVGPSASATRILVIDDEVPLLKAYQRMLGTQHRVVTASRGQAALELLARDADFDVILCDLMMPDMDGVGFFDALRAAHPDLAGRVVFCTGGAFTTRSTEFLDRTSARCLQKPIELESLEALLAEMSIAR